MLFCQDGVTPRKHDISLRDAFKIARDTGSVIRYEIIYNNAVDMYVEGYRHYSFNLDRYAQQIAMNLNMTDSEFDRLYASSPVEALAQLGLNPDTKVIFDDEESAYYCFSPHYNGLLCYKANKVLEDFLTWDKTEVISMF